MTNEQIPNLILGTGPTAIATAFALRRLNIPFEVLDVGYDLEPEKEALAQTLAGVDPANWSEAHTKTLFPLPVASVRSGVEKRLSFSSTFPYHLPQCLACSTSECSVELSHGIGGFGNVWGAAILPYNRT